MTAVMAIGWAGLAVCALAVFLGALLQRLAGQGFGMIAAPVVAIVAPEFLPATLLLIGAVVGFSATAVDASAVTRRELPAGFAGRALGAVIAAWIAARLAQPEALAMLVALIVYLGIALSVLGLRVAITAASLFSAGILAGIMGTLTAIGAPPMALLYQHEDRRRSAAMQNTFFAWGMIVSLAALAFAGLVGVRHMIFAAVLVPAALVALGLSAPLARRVEKTSLRPYALGLAGIAATTLLVKLIV